METPKFSVVMHEHFSLSVFHNISPKGEQALIFTAQPAWGATVFLWICECIWKYWSCLKPQLQSLPEGGVHLFPPRHSHTQSRSHTLWKIKNHSLRSHNFLLKTQFLASSFVSVLQGKGRRDCWTMFRHCFG